MECAVALNGLEVWAYVVELTEGLRMRLALDDWHKLNLDIGCRVPVRLAERADVWLFVTHATELPPLVWVVMEKRIRPR